VETFTIGQLAHQAGVNVETVRYYERRGLLRAPPRTAAGYRQYSGSDLWRLQFIARAKQLGFTLSEIAGLVGPDEGRAGTRTRGLAEAKIRALDEQRRELATTRARLTRLIDICEDPDSEDCTNLRITS
jgi:MerR family mercuric resistance operon transcriptional regulator